MTGRCVVLVGLLVFLGHAGAEARSTREKGGGEEGGIRLGGKRDEINGREVPFKHLPRLSEVMDKVMLWAM